MTDTIKTPGDITSRTSSDGDDTDGSPFLLSSRAPRRHFKPWDGIILARDLSWGNLPPIARRLQDAQVTELFTWSRQNRHEQAERQIRLGTFWPADFDDKGRPEVGRKNWGLARNGRNDPFALKYRGLWETGEWDLITRNGCHLDGGAAATDVYYEEPPQAYRSKAVVGGTRQAMATIESSLGTGRRQPGLHVGFADGATQWTTTKSKRQPSEAPAGSNHVPRKRRLQAHGVIDEVPILSRDSPVTLALIHYLNKQRTATRITASEAEELLAMVDLSRGRNLDVRELKPEEEDAEITRDLIRLFNAVSAKIGPNGDDAAAFVALVHKSRIRAYALGLEMKMLTEEVRKLKEKGKGEEESGGRGEEQSGDKVEELTQH